MTLHVIGAGVGRTGTNSLRLALDQLALGPCYHMHEVIQNMGERVPLWSAAIAGNPDWSRIYAGYHSAVDWPTACFYRELLQEYPSAKFVLTHRDPGKWAESFGETISQLLKARDEAPPEMRDWLAMANNVVEKTGFSVKLDRAGLIEAFNAHNNAVRAAIPAEQLLDFEVKDGWQPLCEFLGVPAPSGAFPRTNQRDEFWDMVGGKS